MAIDPPYRFDPFQNLVNVSWEEPTGGFVIEYGLVIGLATASSGDGPSYVTTGGPPQIGTYQVLYRLNPSGSVNTETFILGTWTGWPDAPGGGGNFAIHFGAASYQEWGEASLSGFALSTTLYRSDPITNDFFGPSLGGIFADWSSIVFTQTGTGIQYVPDIAYALSLPWSGSFFGSFGATVRMKRLDVTA